MTRISSLSFLDVRKCNNMKNARRTRAWEAVNGLCAVVTAVGYTRK